MTFKICFSTRLTVGVYCPSVSVGRLCALFSIIAESLAPLTATVVSSYRIVCSVRVLFLIAGIAIVLTNTTVKYFVGV